MTRQPAPLASPALPMQLKSTTPYLTRFVFFPMDLGIEGFRRLASFSNRWRDVYDREGILHSPNPLAGTVIGTKRTPGGAPPLAVLLDCNGSAMWISCMMMPYFHVSGRRWQQVEQGTNILNNHKEFRAIATASEIQIPPIPANKVGHAEAWRADYQRQGLLRVPTPLSPQVEDCVEPEDPEGEDGVEDEEETYDDPVQPPPRIIAVDSYLRNYFTQAEFINPFTASALVISNTSSNARNS